MDCCLFADALPAPRVLQGNSRRNQIKLGEKSRQRGVGREVADGPVPLPGDPRRQEAECGGGGQSRAHPMHPLSLGHIPAALPPPGIPQIPCPQPLQEGPRSPRPPARPPPRLGWKPLPPRVPLQSRPQPPYPACEELPHPRRVPATHGPPGPSPCPSDPLPQTPRRPLPPSVGPAPGARRPGRRGGSSCQSAVHYTL